jgi:putative FmdB family regulatory protein
VPTYEYECTACGQHIEVFQRFSEDPLTTCGACGGPLRKVFHPAGIVFKGSGFYATDSRSKPSSKDTSGESKKKDDAKTTPASTDGGSKPTPPSSEGTKTTKPDTKASSS